MRRRDLGAAVGLTILALYVFYETAAYPDSPVPGSPGPAFFPRLLAGALLFLLILLFWTTVRRGEAAPDGASAEVPGSRPGRVLLTIGLVVGFLLLATRVDFFVLLPLLLFLVMVVMGERSVPALVAVPLLFDIFVYVIFYRFFGVPFPTLL